MYNLLGEYEIAMDAKGRFLVPAGFRKQLPEEAAGKFVINRGFENCLTLYPVPVWEALSEKINKLNEFKPGVRNFKRLFMNGATLLEVDSAGRLLLPKALQTYAGIQKEIVFAAQGNKVEIWDKETYYEFMKQQAENLSDLAAEIAEDGMINPFENL